MSETIACDIAIVGGGLVGASLALALANTSYRVVLVEGQQPPLTGLNVPEDWDARVYAISPANRRFLESIDAWPAEDRIQAVKTMDVRGDTQGEIVFSASDADQPALTYIAENRWLLAAIWEKLRNSRVQMICPARPVETSATATARQILLEDGRAITARLVIGADGANSWLRRIVGIEAAVSPYGQSGVVANFVTQKDHQSIAHQWFTGDSVLAYLPLPDHRMSMVWSRHDPEYLLGLSAEALCAEVEQAGYSTLGKLQLLTPPAAFPLRLIQPETVIAERLALVGDAAHTVHPLAGQGVNLGFGDAIEWAGLLASGHRDPGEYLLLRRYERSRREAVRVMQTTCDGLHKLFHAQDPLLRWMRNTGLDMTNRFTPAKRLLARHAIGF